MDSPTEFHDGRNHVPVPRSVCGKVRARTVFAEGVSRRSAMTPMLARGGSALLATRRLPGLVGDGTDGRTPVDDFARIPRSSVCWSPVYVQGGPVVWPGPCWSEVLIGRSDRPRYKARAEKSGRGFFLFLFFLVYLPKPTPPDIDGP